MNRRSPHVTLAGYSNVKAIASGLLFRTNNDELSTGSVGRVFDNTNGLGLSERLRYDTPSYAGFSKFTKKRESRSQVADNRVVQQPQPTVDMAMPAGESRPLHQKETSRDGVEHDPSTAYS